MRGIDRTPLVWNTRLLGYIMVDGAKLKKWYDLHCYFGFISGTIDVIVRVFRLVDRGATEA